MPEYKFRNKDSGEEWLQWLTISERTALLDANPHVEQMIHGFPKYQDTVRLGRTKPDESFRDLLSQLKKNNRGSNINDYKG